MAAVTATLLTASGSATDTSSYATASITPSANALVLASIYSNELDTSTPPVPSLSGNGLTWTQVATATAVGSSGIRLTIFRGVSGAPSSGAITIDFSGNTQADCQWSIVEFANLDISGANGANAVVQSATNADADGASSLTVTLSAFSHPTNVTFGATAMKSGPIDLITVGSGFTELSQVSSPHNTQTQWKNGNDTSVDWSYDQDTVSIVGIGLELRPSPVGGGGLLQAVM